jgi:alpha-tubulin suppressor-like RCC1 family protein
VGVDLSAPGAFTSVAAGGDHTCGIDPVAQVWCWGLNDYRQLGAFAFDECRSPDDPANFYLCFSLPVSLENAPERLFTEVSVGTKHTCARATVGEIWCWGNGLNGQLGDGDLDVDSAPVVVPGSSWTRVEAGAWHTCGLETGRISCWGDGGSGRIGSSDFGVHPLPTPLQVEIGWQTISAGGTHTCGVDVEGGGFCWGSNTHGQLGDGTFDPAGGRPVPIGIDLGDELVGVATGDAHSCAWSSSRVWCWGGNADGRLGNASTAAAVAVPVRVRSEQP